MDYRLFAPGTTAWFPVSVPGAFFYLGDGHACQGDGEIVGTGIETSFEMEVTFRVLERDGFRRNQVFPTRGDF
jgi:amidase